MNEPGRKEKRNIGIVIAMSDIKQVGAEYDVICIGSALLDVYMKSDKFVKVHTSQAGEGVALAEVYGGKTEVAEAVLVSGGGGTNNAVSFARKGLRTSLIAEMGTDLVSAAIKEELVREKVNTSLLVQESSEQTGISTIMVASDGTRSVAVHRGASKMLTKSDIPWDRLYPNWLHISSLGGEMELLEGLLGHAKACGIRVALNPGMAEIQQLGNWGGLSLFAGIDLLLVNREEASALLAMDLTNDSIWQRSFSVTGPKLTVITDGLNEGKVCEGKGCRFFAVEKVTMVEQTGAGDAFGTGMVAGLMVGKSVDEALAWGKKQAASVVSFMGPKRGLLSMEEISR